jgi:hypothetical protein
MGSFKCRRVEKEKIPFNLRNTNPTRKNFIGLE